jgi:hypothetical protein
MRMVENTSSVVWPKNKEWHFFVHEIDKMIVWPKTISNFVKMKKNERKPNKLSPFVT